MMYCSFCKKQIEDDALFCPYCGKSAPQGDALAELAAAAHTGDQDAIGALYEKTYSKVYYTVKSMIKDEDAVFDIVQDTYIKAFARLDSFQGDTKFLPWVRQIAANTARDWLKKKRPMLFAELSSGDGQDTPVEELLPDERSDNLPDQIIDQRETKRLIHEIIEELPEDQRAVIGMFYYEEMSVKEIAAAMGVSESAVKSRLMYGRNKIEKKVLELEKKGTKLYSLSPLLFLLLLFRSQKAYACEVPDGRILQAIRAAQPTGSAAASGAAQGADKTGAAADAGTAGAGGAGTAAAAGGLGALKIGLIALAAVAVVGLGAFGAIRIASHSSEPQQSQTGNLVGQKEPGVQKEPEASVKPEAPKEPEVSAEPGGQKESEGQNEPSATKEPGGQKEPEAPKETETPAETEKPSAPAETEEPSFPASYIFSDIPFAAYEVTGLGVGLNDAEHVIGQEGWFDWSEYPFVKRDPSNTFVLFCMRNGNIIRSSSGSSQWEANEYYKAAGEFYPEAEDRGYTSSYKRNRTFHEAAGDDEMGYMMAGWGFSWVSSSFLEIYHPDAPQEDTIYVTSPSEDGDAEAREEIINGLKYIGATNVQEISVEEALKKFHIIVSKEEMEQVTFYGPEDKYNCTSYVIPDGVRTIGGSAFSDCSALTSIEIPNSVKGIGVRAFYDCSALTGIEIPNSVTVIGNGAFCGCESLTSIEIPNSVTWIGNAAFMGCKSLTSIEIPNSVTKINRQTFDGCTSLTSIEIPSSVTWIGSGAFYECSALKTIKVPEGLDVSRCGLGEGVQVIYY